MTAPTTTPMGDATSASPDARALWRIGRAPLVILVVFALLAVAIAITQPRGKEGLLDPEGVNPAGAHALAVLLTNHGVDVTKVTSARDAIPLTGPDTTVLVALSSRVPPAQLRRLVHSDSDLVVLAPFPAQLGALPIPVHVAGFADDHVREPDCELRAASLAGSALTGGYTYAADPGAAVGCYPHRDGESLVYVPGALRTITLLSTGRGFTNEHLDDDGNAALALNVIGTRPHVVWVVPTLAGLAGSGGGTRTLTDLLPDRLLLGAGQLAVAVLLLALWRARRLGPVVAEPLPVIVRAAETVEGRARLYRAAAARDRAADALRADVRDRLGTALGLPRDADPPAVTAALAQRTSREPGQISALLYGAAPPDDAALVQLANDLDALDREVRRP
jgi:hypothetical protein